MTHEADKQAQKFEDLPPEQKAQVCFMNAAKLHKENKLDDALTLYAQAIAFHPKMADALNNMAVALRKKGHFEAALACYRRSLNIREGHAGTYSNMGNVLNDLDFIDESIAAHAKAVALSPNDLLYQYNMALVLRDAGRFEEAITLFDRVLEKEPQYKDCPWDRALTYLLAGDFKKGFAAYDSRWSLAKSPPRQFIQPRWDGRPLWGRTLFIHREQGFGDALQFVRLASVIKEQFGGHIIMECQPELISIFERVEGIDQLVPYGQTPPAFDVWIPLMSIAQFLEIDADHIAGTVPYLFPNQENRFRIRPSPEGGLNIGVVWAGSPTHQNDRRRSVDIEHFFPLTSHPHVTLFSLQKGARADDIVSKGAQGLLVDAGREIKDFDDTASIVASMDLIISVDTSVVHLAAGMGKPVWVLLPYSPDWRWMWGRSDSPWYPSLQILRQDRPGDWTGVFKKVYQALEDRLSV